MAEPTTPVVQDQSPAEEPRAAVIELIERHTGEKYPYSGAGSIIVPNVLRINGVAMWGTFDAPVVVKEIAVGGNPAPFKVTVQLLARALRIGETPAFDPGAEGDPEYSAAAVVEIPDIDSLEPGSTLDRPYLLLNGHRLYTEGSVGIGEIVTDGKDRTAATVTLTLLCRKFVVDDEVIQSGKG